jgi:DNA invertase Pin-like site-specific DNA recombinase
MRVVCYARVSTSDKGQKPELQLNEIRKYCELRGWSILHEIIDEGFSGGTDVRPGLKMLMAMVRAREVDTVIVLKLDRLFRSLKHLVTTLDEFQEKKIVFVAVRDNVDYSTPAGKLMTQILASMAEFEKSLLKERTLLGLEHARSKGIKLGRPKKRDDEAIKRLWNEGRTQRQIAKDLRISKTAVQRCLKNWVPIHFYLSDAY